MYKKWQKLKPILKGLRQGQPIYALCRKVGIDPVTFWYWRQDNPRLDDVVEKIRTSRVQMVEDALFKTALEGNVAAQCFFLKNRGKNWRDTALIDQSQHTLVQIVNYGKHTSSSSRIQRPAAPVAIPDTQEV